MSLFFLIFTMNRILPSWLGLMAWLMVLSSCQPEPVSSRVQRVAQTVLLITQPQVQATLAETLEAALCTMTDTGYLTLRHTQDLRYLHEDSLLSYSAVVMLGWAGEALSPQQQNHLQRYLQSSNGLLWLDGSLRSPLDWPWLQKGLAGPAVDTLRADSVSVQAVADRVSEASTMAFSAYPYDGGRLVRMDSLANLVARPGFDRYLQRSVVYAMGDNAYDYGRCRVPLAPQDERFTVEVLDEFDLDEPMQLAVLPDRRVLLIERKGRMKLYDPATERSRVIHRYDVCTRGNYEDGLLGLALAPDFVQSHWVYLYYSPGSACERPQTLSRFRWLGDSLDLASEQIILEVPVQRETCCHSGGDIAFGPDSCLWLSTGDNTSSKASDGYTPIDERPGRGPFDAQKSSANTHDLRGKILRIRPHDSLPSYEIPADNLFPPDGSQGRPEIYAMGCRNPFRLAVDAETGWLYWGDVGPDGGDSSRYGPQSYDEFNQARQPGNFGWPYFTADNLPYPERDFAMDTIGPYPDPLRPVNPSPHNTGSQTLPPVRPAMIWYPYGPSDSFPMLGVGSRSAMAGPVFRRKSLAQPTEASFPAYYEGKLLLYEWARSWLKWASFDSTGQLVQIEPFLPQVDISKPIDVAFGPEGALYVLTYGANYFMNNPEAQLIRIAFAPGNRQPVPQLYVDAPDGAAPHQVNLSAYQSYDLDPLDSTLRYYWRLTQDTAAEDSGVDICFTYERPGVYHPQLLVVDAAGDTAMAEAEIRVGNAPPEIELTYTGNRQFFFPGQVHQYRVQVRDPEDEAQGRIAQDRVDIRWVAAADGHDLEVLLGQGELPQGDPEQLRGLRLVQQSDCQSCHAEVQSSVGPSYRAVAERYRGDHSAAEMLARKIITGGNGHWGERLMAAHPQHSMEETRAMARYILSLGDPALAGQRLDTAGRVQSNATAPAGSTYLLAATYTDGGADTLPPLTRRATLLLRHPRLQVETAPLQGPGIWLGTVGENRDVEVAFGLRQGAWLGWPRLDWRGVAGVRIKLKAERAGVLQVRRDSPQGPVMAELAIYAQRKKPWREVALLVPGLNTEADLYLTMRATGQEPALTLDWLELLPESLHRGSERENMVN
jgi:cytochrome c